MIKVSFIAPQRKIIRFEIENLQVRYFDEIWKKGIQIIPKDNHEIIRMKRSGKKNLQFLVALILDSNKGENFEEYSKCKTDLEVSEIIKKDCKSRGLILLK